MKIKMISLIILFALFAAITQAISYTSIPVENYSFELPGTGSITGWDNSSNDIPGWSSDSTATGSGIVSSSSGASDGSYYAILKATDPTVYNLTDHVIAKHEVFVLQLDTIQSSGGGEFTMILYYEKDGIRYTAASGTASVVNVYSYQTNTLTFSADDVPAAVGYPIGIEIDSTCTTNNGSNWMALDNVRLGVGKVAPSYTDELTVVNYSFELPGEGKIKSWDLIPGWSSDSVPSDSGVETGTCTEGAYRGFLMHSDPSVFNLTDHVIVPNEAFVLQADLKSTDYVISLYYDNNGTRNTFASLSGTATSAYKTCALTADANEIPAAAVGHKVGIEIDSTSSGWLAFDNVHLGRLIVGAASNPSPVNNAVDVPVTETALSWDAAVDSNDPNVINSSVVAHYLYMLEKDVDFAGEPNFIGISPVRIAVDGNPLVNCSIPMTLKMDKIYYWCIDEVTDESIYPDPNGVIFGQIWNFRTIQSVPIITVQPEDTAVYQGDDAQFTVTVESLTTPTYAWYHSADDRTDTVDDDNLAGNMATLTLSAAAGSQEGYYYCIVGNSGNTRVYSNVVTLIVYRQVAHWSLDYLTAGQYIDSSAQMHYAAAVGFPTFVTGAGSATGNGVRIETSGGYADAGTWNPSAYTGKLSISLWAKWAGQPSVAVWQGLFAKRNSLAADDMMWQLAVGPEDNKVFFKNASYSFGGSVMPTGQWTHIAVTFNGTTAVMYINGVSAASKTMSLNTGIDANVVIGAAGKTGLGVFEEIFSGELDDIQMFNYEVDKYQIADLYYQGSGYRSCLNSYDSQYDFNSDCQVNSDDLLLMLDSWLDEGYAD